MNISNLLKANKIIVVGASEKESSFGGDTCRNIMDFSNSDKYYFVNPNRESVFGKKCYPSIDDIEEDCDLVIICTPQGTVIDMLKSASKKGCKGAVVYASGYSEAGTVEGHQEEEKLVKACEELGITLLGPNCGGFINYHDDVYSFAFIAEKRDRKGKIGLVSQSGQLCLSMMDSPKGKFSYVISAGNASAVKVEEYIDYLVEDENTKVVSVYLEGVSNPKVLENALKKAAMKRKPVVVLKTGISEKGSQISASHTGSLSGSDKAYDAIFKKFGVIRVKDMEELLSMSHLLSTIDVYPEGNNFAAMSVSGGETIITADLGAIEGVEFGDLKEETLKKLKNLLPSYATPNNPLDMTATISYDSEKLAGAIQAVTDDENIDMVIIGYTLLLDVVDPCIHYITEGIEIAKKNGVTKPIVMMPFIENTRNREYAEKLEALSVPILPTSSYAMSILKKFSDFIAYDFSKKTLSLAIPEEKYEGEGRFLSENESKRMLGDFGIPVPKECVAKTVEDAVEFANTIKYPIVMKIESEDIPHKSDIGGVKINILDEDELKLAFEEISNNARVNAPNAKVNGILVQEMLPYGTEMIVGINNDPNYGPMIMCGLGGVFVEIFKDVSLYPAPFNKDEALDMIKSLKGYKLLTGYRGNKELDVNGLADLLVQVSDFSVANKDRVLELDMNPVFLYEKGLALADSLIKIRRV